MLPLDPDNFQCVPGQLSDCSGNRTTNIPRTASGSGRSRHPFSERQSLAESFDLAAGNLDSGEHDRPLVYESIRIAIAVQPTSGRWATEFTKIIPPNPTAEALRQIAKGLKQGNQK
jgi:hypothetical protein